MNDNNEEQKEEFCGACLAVPLAFAAGGGGVAASSTLVDRKKHKKLKKTMFMVGILVAVLAILYSGYILYNQKKASSGGLAVCSR
jgi:uncharacterized membrane protein YebE (DUF533 family)